MLIKKINWVCKYSTEGQTFSCNRDTWDITSEVKGKSKLTFFNVGFLSHYEWFIGACYSPKMLVITKSFIEDENTHTYTHPHTHAQPHTQTRTHTHAHKLAHMHTRSHTYKHAHTHARKPKRTHTHKLTHTHTLSPSSREIQAIF